MADLLKIMLADATEAEQELFQSFSGELLLMTAEPKDGKELHKIIKEYNGKEEILQLLAEPFPTDCFLGIREIEYQNESETMVIYVSRVYLIAKPGSESLYKYDILPTSSPLYLFNEAITYHGKEKYLPTTKSGTRQRDRHKVIKYRVGDDDDYTIAQTNNRTGEKIEITFTNAGKMQGKGVKKCFAFLLTQSNLQNFSPVIGFSLQELVSRGMYSTADNARRGLKAALDTLQNIKFSGTIKKGNKKSITQAEAGVLFYHYKIKNNYVEVSVNENFNIEFIAAYYALFPKFSYGLKNSNAFDLCEYIFMQARQNSREIKQSNSFNISFNKIRELLALPEEKDIPNKRNWKPKQYVIDPILTAIADLQSGADSANYADFEIETIYNGNYKNLNEFLSGYIKITFKGEIYSNLIKIAEKQEEKIEKAIEQRERRIAELKAKAE